MTHNDQVVSGFSMYFLKFYTSYCHLMLNLLFITIAADDDNADVESMESMARGMA